MQPALELRERFFSVGGRLESAFPDDNHVPALLGLFVEFIALIILSYIKKHMQDASLFGKYTLQGLLDELDVIESLEVPGKDPIYGEVLERQVKVYEAMGVTPPMTTSLCVSGI